MQLIHDIDSQQFVLDINGENAKVEYNLRDGQMFLVHSEVPYNLRGQGIGKVLVEKSFEKLTKEGFQAVAVCTFIKAIAKRSEKWQSIIG
ncbi:MAG: N-acetyltransferase [Maribacter sp.]|nr:N-acetyltransferase [Maribacter sp.]